jgi:hypothetical protein
MRVLVYSSLMSLSAVLSPAQSQSQATVRGQIVEAGTGTGIPNAVVALDGYGAKLTSDDGAFVFHRVGIGTHALRVEAFGYATRSIHVAVSQDTTIVIALDIAPLELEELVVESVRIDVVGSVRDPARDLPVADAEVSTNQVLSVRTSGTGRFKLDGVREHALLGIRIRSLGYLPFDTVLVPAEGEHLRFEVFRDPIAERMIDTQIDRLQERAGGRLAPLMMPMGREEILWLEGGTIAEVLEVEYNRSRARRFHCVLIDEEVVPYEIQYEVLQAMPAANVERIEVLFDGAMLRIYTRDFIRDMMAGTVELRRPAYVAFTRPPFCA